MTTFICSRDLSATLTQLCKISMVFWWCVIMYMQDSVAPLNRVVFHFKTVNFQCFWVQVLHAN